MSEADPMLLVAVQRYVPESPLLLVLINSVLPVDELVNEYFAVDEVICVWALLVAINVHEMEALGLADTTQVMVTSCPETEL